MVFHPPAAAAALDDGVRNDDLGGGQVGVFCMVDDLICRLLTQEEGVDIHGSELRGGQLGIEGIIRLECGLSRQCCTNLPTLIRLLCGIHAK